MHFAPGLIIALFNRYVAFNNYNRRISSNQISGKSIGRKSGRISIRYNPNQFESVRYLFDIEFVCDRINVRMEDRSVEHNLRAVSVRVVLRQPNLEPGQQTLLQQIQTSLKI